jgi:hypothetical protein
MQMSELPTRHLAGTLREFLLFLYEQTAQYLRGLEADFVTPLSRISCKGLRSTLRWASCS